MARRLRVQYPGAIYHVMDRGDRRETMFWDDADRQRFLTTLGGAWKGSWFWKLPAGTEQNQAP